MDEGPVVLVAFGNSITLAAEQVEGRKWPSQLASRIEKHLRGRGISIINAGEGGNTSREGLARIEPDVLVHRPHLVTVEFGGNDATPEPNRHVDLPEFRGNLESIRRRVEDEARGRVVLLTFPPVIDAWHAWGEAFADRDGPDAAIEEYRRATRGFARSRALPLADVDKALRAAIAKHGAQRYIRPDGVHLTAPGNEVVADLVGEVLLTILPELGGR